MTNGTFDDAVRVWNERFSVTEFVFGTEPNACLAKHASLMRPGQRALAVAVDKAQRLARSTGVEVDYRLSDCEAWNWKADANDLIAANLSSLPAPACGSA